MSSAIQDGGRFSPVALGAVSAAMKPVLLLALIFSSVAPVFGGQLVMTSPDHARTFAYGEMIWHQLDVDSTGRVLTARITFSNLPYASDSEPRADETFDFRFPGLARSDRTLVGRIRRGQEITVARYRGNATSSSVELAAGAKIYLLKENGRVTAVLTATDRARPGVRWRQMDDNWSLQNLLANFFGPRSGAGG